MNKRNLMSWGVFVVMLFSMLAPASIFAAATDYHSDDVTAINNLIQYSNLQATQADPDNWDFAVWDKTVSPYRLKELNLSNKDLSNVNITNLELEKLDVSKNPNIYSLSVPNNKLRELNIEGVDKLRILDCSNNDLTQVKFTEDHKNLVDITLDENQLTSLDMPTTAERLQYLSCKKNKLTTFALADIPRFQHLILDYNKLETLSLKDLPMIYTLTVSNNRLTSIHGGNVGSQSTTTIKLDNQHPTARLVGNAKHGYNTEIDFKNPTFTDSQGTVQSGLLYESGKLRTANTSITNSNFTAETNLENINTPLSGTIQLQYTTIHKITAKAGKGGSISPSNEVTVKENNNQRFNMKAKKGYRLSKVVVDGKEVSKAVASGNYTFKKVNKDHTIKAEFKKLPRKNDNNGKGGNKNKNGKNGGNNKNIISAKTSDNSEPILWGFALFTSLSMLIILLRKYKKHSC